MNGNRNKPNMLAIILAGILAGAVAKNFCIDILKVEGTSMEPAIPHDSYILVNKLAYGIQVPFSCRTILHWNRPKTGDCVIFMREGNYVVKRVQATENTALEFSAGSGYTMTTESGTFPLSELQYHLIGSSTKVPPKTVLVIGDNYEQSIDSRNYGFVSEENILGRVLRR